MSHSVSTAAKPADLDKAYASAVKALSTLGIKMNTKKPDAAKLTKPMAGGKPAEFKLVAEKGLLKLVVECPGVSNTLGVFDAQAEKDLKKRLATLQGLQKQGFVDYSKEIMALEKELKGGPDRKVLDNIDRALAAEKKKADDARAKAAAYANLRWGQVRKSADLLKEVEAFAVKSHSEENIFFLKAVAANMSHDKLVANFFAKNAKYLVNCDEVDGVRDGSIPVKTAAATIESMVDHDVLKKFGNARQAELKKTYDDSMKAVAKLDETKKKALAG